MFDQLAYSNIEPPAQVSLRIVIVEDDPVMQLGLEQFLEDYESFEIVGRADNGYSGIALNLGCVLKLQPHDDRS